MVSAVERHDADIIRVYAREGNGTVADNTRAVRVPSFPGRDPAAVRAAIACLQHN